MTGAPVYPGAASFLSLPAGAGKPKEKGSLDMPNTLVVAPALRGGEDLEPRHGTSWDGNLLFK